MPNALRRQTLHQEQELWYDQKLKRTESIFLERQLLSIFVEFLLTNSEPIWGPHHEKHNIRENFNHRKNDPPPKGDPWTPKILISQLESFEQSHPYFSFIFY